MLDHIETAFPLSPLQKGMLFHTEYAPGESPYFNQASYGLEGTLNVEALERAWQAVVNRHTALRTTFVWQNNGEPVQRVAAHAKVPFEEHDWKSLSEDEQQTRWAQYLDDDCRRGFDMSIAPLMRLAVFHFSETKHKILWSSHHIIVDGWSTPIILEEVFAHYAAYCRGRDLRMKEAKPYKQYVDWIQQQDLEKAETYWRRSLAGITSPTSLGIARSTPATNGKNNTCVSERKLSLELSNKLRTISREQFLTPSTLAHGAWAILLSRYSGQEKVLFGSVVSGRPPALREVTRMVGLFINSLPVRIDVDGKKPVNRWLRELQEHQADMREYSYSSLSEIQRWSEIPSPQALFESILIFENYPTKTSLQEEIGPAISKQGLGFQVVSVDAFDHPDFPMCIAVDGRNFHLQAIYDGRLFNRNTVDQMLNHFENLLEAITRNPTQRIQELPLLSEEEERQAIVEWNNTQREFPAEQSVSELFERQAALRPDAVAVVHGSEHLSYGELSRRANQLAHYLKKQGVRPEVVVGLCTDRSLEMVVGLLGILKAGGAYLPLDPDYPQQRLDYMLSDAQVGLVLAQGRFLDQLPVHLGLTVVMDEEWATIAAESEENPPCETDADNLAYVIYTSGSTGQPKGIGISHRAISRLVLGTDYVQLMPEDRVAQASTISFDAATFEIWGPLLNGARLVIVDKELALSPRDFELALREQEISTLFLTTALFNRLAQNSGSAFQGLKHLLFGGELVDPRWVRAVLEQGAPERLLHVYGPTESTTYATWELVEKVNEDAETVPIGKPLANTTLYVLDQWLRPVPVGVRGEIYIGGDGLARGYVNDPARTAERFVPHPYGPGERLYRTGDEARYLENGHVEFLGRYDQQVKVRGYRIELGEIEAALVSHPGVREAVINVREENAGLVAYVVGAEGESWLGSERLAGAELRAFLRERLPEYMVPQRWMVLDHLPLNANGKVDRDRLPAPSAVVEAEYGEETEWTPVEELVGGIWSEVLKLKAVGRDENFFELGGHSLLATQVISHVREVFGVDVELRKLFEQPSVREFSRNVEAALRAGAGVTAPPLQRVSGEEREELDGLLPLSFAQLRLCFLDQLEPGSASYNVPLAVRLTGDLNVAALERTLSEIVRRHEVLRTRFVNVGGEPRQEVLPAMPIKLAVTDLSGLDDAEAAVSEAAVAESWAPFDLAHGPMRVKLLRLSDEEHVVLLTLHHIVSDGWSLGVLIREVAVLYAAYNEGAESPLPELKVQYSDFAVWQRGWLQGAELERQLSYWREQLGGEVPALELPTDHTRPAVPSNRGAWEHFSLSNETTAALRELSRREGVTLFMTLLAAFQTLLHRYSGQSDIVVGSPVAGRNYAETENLIGFFVNTLPLRVQLSGELPFVELLKQVKEVCLGVYAHQDVPFEKLVEELQPRREGSRSPLYQVVLTLQNAPRVSLALSGLRLEKVDSGLVTGKYELNFSLTETGEQLSGFLEYHEELFEAETIRRLLGDFTRLLELVVENPAAAVGRLRFLNAVEEHELLVERNQTQRQYDTELRLRDWLAREAKQHWEQVAVVAGGHEITYGELESDAETVATRLRAQGVREGWRVGILLEHSYELIVGLLGVLKTGAAYVPLAAGQGELRNQQLLRDSGVELVLTQAELQSQVPDDVAKLVWSGGKWLFAEGGGEIGPAPGATRLVYVMYTSGTTGKAKGVEVEEASLLNYLHWALEQYVRGEQLSFGLCTSVSFDLTVTALYLPLLSGGRIVLYEPGAEAVAAVLRENRVEVLKLTPSHLEQLRGQGHEGSRLRRLIVGGEALSERLAREVVESFGDTLELYNEYGPTEATVGCMVHRYELGEESGAGVSIGHAAANTEIYVLDAALEPVGENVVGEIYIGGAGLARGYWQNAEQTAERFVPHPYSAAGGERLYRSGDLGRWRRGGKLEYVGRRDEQVKYKGHRVELQELRAALNEHKDVRESVVRLERDGETAVLVAYYVSRHELPASELRAWLSERVVKETVPSVYVHLKRLPLGLNGKVNYQELPGLSEWRRQREQAGRAEAGEWTAVEELVAGIWSEVLRLGTVGRNENFFELGGHSLLATQVISRVREVFGVEVGLRRLFEAPTVRSFSRSIEAALRADEKVPVPALRPLTVDEREQWGGVLPLSFAQQRLWFLNQLEPGSAFYNVPAAVRLKGELQVVALERALNEIVRRHEVLRTRFVNAGGEPRQEVLAAQEVKLEITDISELNEAEREAALSVAVTAESREPFDLAHGPLLRVKLLRVSDEEYVVLLTMHHIVSDGWSMALMIKEIAALYQAYSQGAQSPLPELKVQYGDFAVWQRGWLQGEELEREFAYWRQHLGGALPTLELPADRARPAEQTYRGAQLSFRMTPELSAGLKELSRREGVTQFMTLLAAFQVLLSRYSGQDDIIVGTPIAGRNHLETEELIGFFVNTLALRTNLAGNPSFKEVLGRVREVTLGAATHQELPFEKLVEELQPQRDLSRSPVFQVMLALQNIPEQQYEFSNVTLSPIEADPGTARFDLTMFLRPADSGLVGMLEYNTDLFDRDTVEKMLVHYKTLLQSIVNDPEQRILSLPILPETEHQQLLVEWNDTFRDFPHNNCFPQLFEARVKLTPAAVAVESDEETLTYAELNARANGLARFLVSHGAGAETIVAVLAPRSVTLLTAILAIFKAGAAYLPLDPHHPATRHSQILKQSQASIVLVTGELEPVIAELETAARVFQLERAYAGGEENLELRSGPRSLAYVIFTSGSTGLPKGAMIEQRGMINHLYIKVRELGLGPTDIVAQTASQCFDISLWQFLSPLLAGARVRIFNDEVASDPKALLQALEVEAVTVAETVPSMLRAMLAEKQDFVAPLRWMVVTGEALAPEICRTWKRSVGDRIRLLNAYGPTECSDDITHYEITQVPEDHVVRMPIGHALDNTQLYIVDREMGLAPVGVSGELLAGGVGVGRGYLNDAERTAVSFVPDPFSGVEGARLYRTGDLCRYRRDGQIEFLGRIDDQVKVHGYRIELGEIEAALESHAGVRQAVVTVRDEQLVGYVVGESWSGIGSGELRPYLRERLPEYMVPQRWVMLDQMPLTANGKIDRQRLPEPSEAGAVDGEEGEWTPVEEMVAGIWSEVLKRDAAGRDLNFFELGGHSLLATQVISRVREVFEVEVELRRLFAEPTVQGFSRIVEEALRKGAGVTVPVLQIAGIDEHWDGLLPLSFAQQRIWFLNQLEPDSPFYNMPAAVRLKGALRVDALERTLTEIVRRHEVLRTCFVSVNGEPRQEVMPAEDVKLLVTDLSSLSESEREATVREVTTAEIHEPFDLANGPLLRVKLLRLGEEEHVVVLTMHHIVSDGWSIGVLIKEVAALYDAYSRGDESPLTELPVQYKDFAVWQRGWLQGEELERQLEYWRGQLGGELPVLELPTDRPRPATPSYHGAQLLFHLSPEVTAGLNELSRREGVTLFMTLLAAFQTLLFRYSGQERIIVGSPIANRNFIQTEGLIGVFINQLVLSSEPGRNPLFSDFLRTVKQMCFGAYAHQDLPFEKLIEELQPVRDTSRPAVFQVEFGVQNAPAPPLTLSNLKLEPLELENETSRYDLTLWMTQGGSKLSGLWTYNTDIFDESTIAEMGNHFSVLLESIVKNPATRLTNLEMLTADEKTEKKLKTTHNEESALKRLSAARGKRLAI